jgi:hypothetical protein
MKPGYLGDAKDLAKGFLFSWLRQKELIRGPMVLPFFTCPDADLKGDTVIETYSAILGVELACVLSRQAWPCPAILRTDYLDTALKQSRDEDTVFLDPDTGVRPTLYGKTRTSKNKYVVTFEDVLKVVECDRDRIAIAYDESYSHADRKNLREAVLDKLKDLLAAGAQRKVCGFAYVGMALNLLFVGNQQAAGRVGKIADEMDQFLAGAERRIIRPEQVGKP